MTRSRSLIFPTLIVAISEHAEAAKRWCQSKNVGRNESSHMTSIEGSDVQAATFHIEATSHVLDMSTVADITVVAFKSASRSRPNTG